ncbi:MAG: alpha-ketoglutarate-dependent dioxygenase AlkB [Bacteroidota bacterium]
MAWHGDEGVTYTYSNNRKLSLPWTSDLLIIKAKLEALCGENYNSCLLNLYANGKEGMSWHIDNERELDPNGSIASVSFGAERPFQFRHKSSAELISLMLEPGSLLIMKQKAQAHWQHRLPERSSIKQPRINLTFRKIIQQH